MVKLYHRGLNIPIVDVGYPEYTLNLPQISMVFLPKYFCKSQNLLTIIVFLESGIFGIGFHFHIQQPLVKFLVKSSSISSRVMSVSIPDILLTRHGFSWGLSSWGLIFPRVIPTYWTFLESDIRCVPYGVSRFLIASLRDIHSRFFLLVRSNQTFLGRFHMLYPVDCIPILFLYKISETILKSLSSYPIPWPSNLSSSNSGYNL